MVHFPFGDPIIHLSTYACIIYGSCLSWKKNPLHLILGAGLVFLAIMIESLQAFSAERACELRDRLANTGGVVIGYCFANKAQLHLWLGLLNEFFKI